MNPEIFREYDIRGAAERDLDDGTVALLGRAIGSEQRRAGARRVALGRDCRLHSVRIRDVLLPALADCGLEVVDLGVCATPLLYFAVHHWDLDGGVMVTASHNPPEDNGLKICVGKHTIHGEAIRRLRDVAERRDFVSAGRGPVVERSVLEDYVRFVVGQGAHGRRLRVAIDAGNGPGGVAAVPIFRRLGHEVIELFCEMDGRFPNHHPDPTVPENLEFLIETVRRRRCDLGVAYDGDADRLGVVDETGTILWGDQLMILFARAILAERGGGTFVADVKCSRLLYEDVARRGGRILMWKTGHSLIKEKMRQEGALLGGEMSGHLFFADRYYGFDDALYASVRLAEILSRSDRPLSRLLADLPATAATPEIRLPCPEPRKQEVVEAVRRTFAGRYRTFELDGVRIDFPEGWGLVRASNTQPVLVLRFEATDTSRLAEIRAEVEGLVRSLLEGPGGATGTSFPLPGTESRR
jgi:phosphomannomutase/phosphoglucomutase